MNVAHINIHELIHNFSSNDHKGKLIKGQRVFLCFGIARFIHVIKFEKKNP